MFKWLHPTKTKAAVTNHYAPAALSNMVVSVHSDVGLVRTNNEDIAVVIHPVEKKLLEKKGVLLIVADGMGGHNSGEVASDSAGKIFADTYYNEKGNTISSLAKALKRSNKEVYEHSLTAASLRGMGTTFTAILVLKDRLYMTHVGDSRAYINDRNGIVQLTKDQTLVQQKIDAGEIRPQEARTHPERNVLTNALGTKPFIDGDIELLQHQWTDDMQLLLCSDGLYEYFSKEEIADALNTSDHIDDAGAYLVNEAKSRGGHDNISLIIASGNGTISSRTLKSTVSG